MENIKIYEELSSEIPAIEKIEKGDFSVERSNDIKEYFRDRLNGMLSCESEDDINQIAQGGTSICYCSSDKKMIYKEFKPEGFYSYLEPIISEHGSFFWISDSATDEIRKDFLMRFVRFIAQSRIINIVQSTADDMEKNLFIRPTLYLTSKGPVWGMEHLYGDSLSKVWNLLNDRSEPTVEWVLRRMEMVMETAKNIRTYFHDHEIYHGDIKPDNFFMVKLDNEEDYLIRNIDFDTCTTAEQIRNGYLQRYISTTHSYYDEQPIKDRINGNAKDFESWAILDIWALAKILMVAIAPSGYNHFYSEAIYEPLPGIKQEWYEVFHNQELEKLYKIFDNTKDKTNYNTKLASLYIINELDELLCGCSKNGNEKYHIKSIDDFITGLENIINLIKFMLNKEYSLTPQVTRFAGLKMIDECMASSNENKGTPYKATEDVETIIGKYFTE